MSKRERIEKTSAQPDGERELRLLNKRPQSLKAIVTLLQYQLVALVAIACLIAAIFIGGVVFLLVR